MSELPGRHECCQLMCLPWHYKGGLLLPPHRVREAYLENYPAEVPLQQIVPVAQEILQHGKKSSNVPRAGLDISIKGFSIHVEETSSMPLLAEILEMMRHAE